MSIKSKQKKMRTWDEYFKFPSFKVDFDHEDSKTRITPDDTPVNKDYAVCETEIHCSDVIDFIEDTWRPREKSRENAMEKGTFDACVVSFKKAGTFNSMWKKEKFKKHWQDFQNELNKKEESNADNEGKEGQTA